MTHRDVPAAVRLSHEAGWNQLGDDWLRFLSMEPKGCFVADLDGALAGTTVTCVFGPVAWISMVLVSSVRRGNGIGTRLTEHALGWLEAQRVNTIRLDATSLGRPIYDRLGFVSQFDVARYEGRLPQGGNDCADSDGTEPVSKDELARAIELDSIVTRTLRTKWLTALFAAWPDAMRVVRTVGNIHGYVAARRGARAIQIGPCVARSDAAPSLFHHVARRYAGEPVYLDIPVPNMEARGYAESMGLRVQRHLVRMYRGEQVLEDIEQLWSSSGPELG